VDECVKWCKAAAEEWGYDLVIGGVGRSITKDPWGRDDDGDALRASQTVAFRRREGDDWPTRRAQNYAKWASRRDLDTQPHKLFVTHRYEAHVGAQSPAPREDIAAAVKSTIEDIGSSDVTIFEIWREDAVSTICGGWLEVLLDVLDQDDAFLLHKEGKGADDWRIELPGVELQAKNPWQSPSKHDTWGDAWGESSESTESAESSETYDEEEEGYDKYFEEEYDGGYWDETEDSGWAASDTEGWSKDESDIDTLKAWADWRPEPGWIMEGSWE
jgi:small RNA 2'-O-methyltransferase